MKCALSRTVLIKEVMVGEGERGGRDTHYPWETQDATERLQCPPL